MLARPPDVRRHDGGRPVGIVALHAINQLPMLGNDRLAAPMRKLGVARQRAENVAMAPPEIHRVVVIVPLVAEAVKLALTGAMDKQVVNVTDDAPTSVFEMARIIGATLDCSSAPLQNPWMGRMDGSKLRSLGFRPTFPTVYQAAEAGIL